MTKEELVRYSIAELIKEVQDLNSTQFFSCADCIWRINTLIEEHGEDYSATTFSVGIVYSSIGSSRGFDELLKIFTKRTT